MYGTYPDGASDIFALKAAPPGIFGRDQVRRMTDDELSQWFGNLRNAMWPPGSIWESVALHDFHVKQERELRRLFRPRLRVRVAQFLRRVVARLDP